MPDIQSDKIVSMEELTQEALEAFCEDLAMMFEVSMDFEQVGEPVAGVIGDIRKNFKKLSTVFTVKSEGALAGDFYIIFDRVGTFVLPGIFVMLPERMIQNHCKTGKLSDIQENSDALGEVGNLMVGSWDRIFRENSEGHGHFVQNGTHAGDDWDNTEEAFGLPSDAPLNAFIYSISTESYPDFKCAVVYPDSIFADSAEESVPAQEQEAANHAEQSTADEQSVAESPTTESATASDPVPAAEANATAESSPQQGGAAEASVSEQASAEVSAGEQNLADSGATQQQDSANVESNAAQADAGRPVDAKSQDPEPAAQGNIASDQIEEIRNEAVSQADQGEAQTGESQDKFEEPLKPEIADATAKTAEAQGEVAGNNADKAVEPNQNQKPEVQSVANPEANNKTQSSSDGTQNASVEDGGDMGPVSGAIHNLTHEAEENQQSMQLLAEIKAADVMQDAVFVQEDETVEQVLAKMQQAGLGYVLVGSEELASGIVSVSDVRGAMSPYLQTMFSKWKRPLDLATMKIKVKWIMSSPVNTVRSDASVADVMSSMYKHGGRAVPVTDNSGKICGIITAFDLFKPLIGSDSNNSGKPATRIPLA